LKGERGFALVITLLITALLVALTVEFVSEVFVDTSARQAFTDGQQASLLAGSGIEAAIKLLPLVQSMHPPGSGYTSLEDLEQLGKLLNIEDEKGVLQVTAEEESGKLNINSIVNDRGEKNDVYRGVADRLFIKLGLSSDLLDAVADWIDNNETPETNGAETPYYQTLKPPYVAKNSKLETLEELRLVKGFDKKTLDLLRPYITVSYDSTSPTPQININTAPKEVIAAFADDMTADAVVDYRKSRPLPDLSALSNVPGMGSGKNGLSISTTSFKGTVFRILSEATVNETTRVIEAVVNSSWQILYWREY
jgi:general secretion pathway protein K